MVGIVNYGMGNLLSVRHALQAVGAEVTICGSPDDLREVERIVLPGVGAFRTCMANLHERGFTEAITEAVFRQGKPMLGICLGMQVMARLSFEGGEHSGLAWFNAEVVRIDSSDPALRVPQVGWNEVQAKGESFFFGGLPPAPEFYFVHSYHMRCVDQADVQATCEYGERLTAAVCKDNIFATQFHPEKSQEHGLRVLANFLRWKP